MRLPPSPTGETAFSKMFKKAGTYVVLHMYYHRINYLFSPRMLCRLGCSISEEKTGCTDYQIIQAYYPKNLNCYGDLGIELDIQCMYVCDVIL